MYNSSSSSGRPKTRNQWNDFYMDYNAEKKRKRSLMSESGSSPERMDAAAANNKTKNKNKKKKNSDDPSPIRFESDEEIKTTSKKAKKPIPSDNRNRILFMDDHDDDDINLIDLDDDEDDDVEVQEVSYFSKEKKKDVKEKKKKVGKEEKKKAAALGSRQSRSGNSSSDDEVVFLGESFTSSGLGLKSGSGSGSKVGSAGGMSPDMATCDEVASSTTKTVKDSAGHVSSDESSDSDDAALESGDSDESDSDSSDEEDCDDSEDSDYIKGNSSSSSSSDDDEIEVSSSSEESDEEVEKQKEIDEKHKSKVAEILKSSSKKAQKMQKRIDDKDKCKAAQKDAEIMKDKTANPKKVKKKQKGIEEKQKSFKLEQKDSIKPGGIASRLRSRSKMEEKQASDEASSDSSIHSKEKENQEEKNPKRPKGKLNVKNILLNTMLENEGKFNEAVTLAEDNVPKQLPLKFAFYEEDRSPEKEEWEVEIDNLFMDLQMGRLQSETSSSFAPAMAGESKNGDDGQPCWHPEGHLQILDEQIGIVCKHCDLVFLESKYILPDFAKRPSRRSDRRFFGDSDHPAAAADFELEGSSRNDQTSIHAAGTVWDLVPGHIKARMYLHQRQGFEFIWNNIAGDLLVENLKDLPANGGKGCVISHAPGTGKTGLTVVFLRSFLKLFPLSRPVVIAPRSMLMTWESEFKNWDAGEFPFHNLNSNTLSGKEDIAGIPILRGQPKGKDVNRLLKVYSWAKGSGVLGITYGLFEKMAGDGSSYKEEDEKLRKVLLKFPGLLVLDEGHTPRNEESNIYNTLSKVETPRRIILSGTPFQNNFHELHNTLSLVRPGFRAAGPTKSGGGRKAGRPPTVSNKWASITCSIFNEGNERNVEQLKQIIAPLVHVHKGTILQEKLPGLVITELYLKLTETQQNLQDTISTNNFMEKDNWMTLISVHPSLSPDHNHHDRGGVKSLELDPRQGVKTRFVHELLSLCGARGERVIIFSRLLEPLALIKKQLLASQFFRWTENKEVLYMDGKIPVRHRQERIRAFNDPESDAKVLLASTAACCEGINLIGGSRIVLLDVVWNPSVTRQAISRAYRLGQTRLVYVYNLISSSFEANKYACQAKKDRMSELVFADEGGTSSGGERRSGGDGSGRDVILDAMAEDPSMCSMFERIVQQPKNQQML